MSAPESPQPVDVPDDDKSHVPPLTTRVVIAEDEALIRLDLKEMLEEEGYTVVGEAGDGEQAVELAREHGPDLVILDVKMSKMDGISAAEKIAEENIAPVLMLTAFPQRDLVERARDAGAMAYLVEPLSKTDVVPAIEMAVSRFTELKELEKEVADLTLRLETRKLVDRAKSILQTEYGLTSQRVPVDPEDLDGPAHVDAAGGGGGHRGRRGEEVQQGLITPHTTRGPHPIRGAGLVV
ncbi:Protein-glutamate methylesterase/protein-glutamine glutaminase [Streptomyces purpurascens]